MAKQSHSPHTSPTKKKEKSTTKLWVRVVALGCALLMIGSAIPLGILLLS
ncbi:MAG: hypothetical protein HFJ84_07005 [Clostridiales bacterium]|jgi:hypothetical protein|nr:hypothetical protein [Clostridiales bacterium]